MNYLSKKVLYIDLKKQQFDVKSFTDLQEYIGGLPLALRLGELYVSEKPLIFSIGPLNGIFPYVSKTCVLNIGSSIEEFYIGGSLSSRLQFCGFDALVLVGQSIEPVFLEIDPQGVTFFSSKEDFENALLPGRSCKLVFDSKKEKALLDNYFESPNGLLEKAFKKKFIEGLLINATNSLDTSKFSHYENLYFELLEKGKELVSTPFPLESPPRCPSCVGCPLGCKNSKVGELPGNALVHTLVACEYLTELYSDLGIVFSCLDVLGYDYRHEDLERIPNLVRELKNSLEALI